MRCPIHPKYKGRKKPKYCSNPECTCDKLYRSIKNKPRILPKPTQVIKDKTKYNRKKKHKKREKDG